MVEITEETSLNSADTQRIYDGLLTTDPTGQPRQYAPLVLTLRGPESCLLGGVIASTVWHWLLIDALWVEPTVRGNGYGRRLATQAERVARARGCTRARLDTFDFQARGFYERLGYDVCAQLPDFPREHVQYHMQKVLAPASERAVAESAPRREEVPAPQERAECEGRRREDDARPRKGVSWGGG